MINVPLNILVSWIGQTDLNASCGDEKAGLGPIAQAVAERRYDNVVLLSNYPKKETAAYISWLEQYTSSSVKRSAVRLSGPTNFGEIYEVVVSCIRNLHQEYGENTHLTYHLSPGTPAMAAVWIIVAKTRFAGELIESSKAHGVRTASIPFDISAEFIPELLKRPDDDLARLSAGRAAENPQFGQIVCRSAEMKRCLLKARQVAYRSVPILIEGESGTGKELLARAIHGVSPRKDKPFIAVNCGAIAADLAESEFFGHKKGAFTGAILNRKGHFEMADGGTLFLDEVGELPPHVQVKLLRALQESKIVRVGESNPVMVNVRIMAATNRTLMDEVGAGRFREDLFYRLAVAVIRLPPLRSRSGDLNLLIDHLLEQINEHSAAKPAWEHKTLSVGARNLLLQHSWPGNVRELSNTLTRAVVWSTGPSITQNDIHDALLDTPPSARSSDGVLNKRFVEGFDLQHVIGGVARHYLERAIKEAGGNKTKAAKLLGFSNYQTLTNWAKRYGVGV